MPVDRLVLRQLVGGEMCTLSLSTALILGPVTVHCSPKALPSCPARFRVRRAIERNDGVVSTPVVGTTGACVPACVIVATSGTRAAFKRPLTNDAPTNNT